MIQRVLSTIKVWKLWFRTMNRYAAMIHFDQVHNITGSDNRKLTVNRRSMNVEATKKIATSQMIAHKVTSKHATMWIRLKKGQPVLYRLGH